MSDYFIFDNVSSATYGVYVFPTDTMVQAPARQYTEHAIPGRNGTLLIDTKRFENVHIEYGVAIPEGSYANLAELRNFLASRVGYKKLTDTFDTDHYYMAVYKEDFVPRMDWHGMDISTAKLTFERKPQGFLVIGDNTVPFTTNGSITNPTRFPSKPLLKIITSTSSASTVGIGSTNIVIARQGTIYIDCDIGRAYNGATPLDSYVTLNTIDYPTLAPGTNSISLGTGISRVEITPRWWTL